MNLTQSIKDIKDIIKDSHIVPIEEYVRRIRICKECPFFKCGAFCAKCSCVVCAKARFGQAYCPENKWDKYPSK